LRPLTQAELSDGTLRYLLWVAALLTPRPPELMVLNEPETSLHPDLIPALGRLIVEASKRCQVWVITHSQTMRQTLEASGDCMSHELEKSFGETAIVDLAPLERPPWAWPKR
jgi:predicted ATPase